MFSRSYSTPEHKGPFCIKYIPKLPNPTTNRCSSNYVLFLLCCIWRTPNAHAPINMMYDESALVRQIDLKTLFQSPIAVTT